jgi:hypothetical protein
VTLLEAVELDLRNFAVVSAESQRVRHSLERAATIRQVQHPVSLLAASTGRRVNEWIEQVAKILGNAE